MPASKTLYITQIHAAVGGAALNTVTTTLRTKDATAAANLYAWNTKAIRVFGLGGVADGTLQVPIKVTEKYDIEMTAVVNTSTAAVTGTFYWLLDRRLMALSSSKNYTVTRSDLIESALRKVGEYDQGEQPSGEETKAASLALNLMVKSLVLDGADLFLRENITLFLQKNQSEYLLGTTAEAATSYVETATTAAASSGATTLTVSSTTGMTGAGDGVSGSYWDQDG